MAQNKYVIQVVVSEELWNWVEQQRGDTQRSPFIRSLLLAARKDHGRYPPAQLVFRTPDGSLIPLETGHG